MMNGTLTLQHTTATAAGAGSDVAQSGGRVAQWPAALQLGFGSRSGATRLLRYRHRGPLCVQRPFYPEGPALPHVYLLHPPGGIVSGDRLDIDIDLQAGSHALFTTPGAGRVYRARADRSLQQQRVSLTLAGGASAEWLPGENIIYPGACGRNTTRVNLADGSTLLGWEIHCIGLPASGMPFDSGSMTQRFEVFQNSVPRFVDCLQLAAGNTDMLHGSAGLAGRTVCGLFVSGPFDVRSAGAALIDRLRAIAVCAQDRLGVTLVNDLVAIRYLGHCAWEARQLFIRCWQELRPALLGRAACLPRIWAT